MVPRIRSEGSRSDGEGASRWLNRPDLLDIVEAAHFGPEQVDNDVPGIDQHPIAMGHALDARLTKSGLLEGADQVVGHGADMTVRTPRGHDHTVRHRALVRQIDADEIFSLVVFETGKDQSFHRTGGKIC